MVLGMATSLLIVACNPREAGNPQRTPVKQASMFFERTHNFCSDHLPDRFLIGYYGEDLLENEVHFYIVSHLGDTIYHDKWPSEAFLPESATPNSPDSIRIANIREEMQTLVEGLTGSSAQAPNDSISQAYDLGRLFQYGPGNQSGKIIAYSRKQKEVMAF